MTEDTPRARFAAWLSTAGPGDVHIYHRGNLSMDRTDKLVRHVAGDALDAAQQGKVTLVQRKLGFNDYRYEAVRLRDRDLLLRQVRELATA